MVSSEPYLLFAGNDNCCGGWRDFKMGFPTITLAKKTALGFKGDYDWWHIVDIETREIKREFGIRLRVCVWEVVE